MKVSCCLSPLQEKGNLTVGGDMYGEAYLMVGAVDIDFSFYQIAS